MTMSLYESGITIVCDQCHGSMTTSRTTGRGARGDAERQGWTVAYLAGGMHPTKRSNDPQARDLCPHCAHPRPKGEDLFGGAG